MEDVEKYIDIRKFEGWFGKNWQRTQSNARRIASDLSDIYSGQEVIQQLSKAIRRIHVGQALYGAGTALAGLTAGLGLYAYVSGAGPLDDSERLFGQVLATAVGIALTPLLASIIKLDRRKYFYREIINSLRNRVADGQYAPPTGLESRML